ncbi:GNAT family N-acetyltransferase [Photobacterium phosphoreum]|nr:GNAT family N-acetyltransferase [Photobacterium phosphoreum]PSW17130.1 GNAT family N-acetyltransferase [Photobacterium phosphoreum]
MRMEIALKLSVITLDEINEYKDDLELFLSSIFDGECHIDINPEFRCAVVIEQSGRICACGLGYDREMYQNQKCFKGGIVGGIAVSSECRGQGLGKAVLAAIDRHLLSLRVDCSFLFAYEPKVYQSSGYHALSAPIYYFDKQQSKWNQFIYQGGMIKSYPSIQLSEMLVIEFKGCVY